jgi:hypothetical protein
LEVLDGVVDEEGAGARVGGEDAGDGVICAPNRNISR